MAAGDFLILQNTADTSALPNAGTNLDALWDSTVHTEGTAATYNAGTFTLTNTAPYLIIYTEQFTTTNTTNNERIEGEGRLNVNGVNIVRGAAEGYIRKSSGQQTMVINGMTIYHATAGDTVKTRFYRGDNSTSGTVNRVPNIGGVQILELSSADAFARYTTTAANTMSSTESDLTNWSTALQDTGFTRATNAVTIANTGRYFLTMSGTTSETGTSRIGATVFLKNNGVAVKGVRSYSHIRGADGDQNGAISFAGIVNVTAGDVLTLRSDADSGSMTLDSGAVWQLWKLPAGNNTAIMETSTGNMNNDAIFSWDTAAYSDTASFTATSGTTDINTVTGMHALVFWNQGKTAVDSVQRGYPMGQIAVNGSVVPYSASGAYHRNSSSIGTFMAHSGATIAVTMAPGSTISLKNTVLGAAGSMTTQAGHFSALSLEGLYKNYSYTFPTEVTDVDTDEIISNTQTNVVISGISFGAVQGTGKVELGNSPVYGSATLVEQTSIVSWSDTSITVNIVAGVISDSYAYLYVTSDTGSQAYISVQVGLPPETYKEAMLALSPLPQHYWTFQNTYVDEIGGATANGAKSGGTPTFPTTPIVKGDSYSFLINSSTEYISPADQSDMNTSSTATSRYMGGWIMLDSISSSLSVIWEEGAQVNNYALLNGFGNALMWQFADDGGDYVQAYQDIKLTPNRPYHVLMEFNSSTQNGTNGTPGICGCFLDGVKQSLTNGNPWEVSKFPSHSGNISWGHEGTENLQTGDSRGIDNVDIAFSSPVTCNYSHWFSVQNQVYTHAQIRTQMFEKGALANATIFGDTQANMQLAVDALAGSVQPDYPCGIEIGSANEGNFTLTFDNITFNSRCSMPIKYTGIDTLTIILTNGSNLDETKVGTPYGGTVVFQRPSTFTVDGINAGSIVSIFDNEVANAGNNDTLLATTASSGTSFSYVHSGATNNIRVQVINPLYVEIIKDFTLGSTDQTLSLEQVVDIN